MKKINYILIIVAILGYILAVSVFNTEGVVLKVNSKNRDIIYQSLKEEIENPDNVTKIILGQGWNSGKLKIYHSFKNTETLYVTEGMFKLGELEKYVEENGYNLDNIGFVLMGVSSLIIFYLIIYKYKNKE